MLEQMRADEFLKEGREIKVNGGGGDGGGGGGIGDGSGDHLVLLEDDEVDIPSDDGEGSDISDAMARDLAEMNNRGPGGRSKTLGIIGPQTTTTNTKKLAMMGNGVGKNGAMGVLAKKGGDRSLLAGTTVVNRREPRSSKTARIYSYGSLLADDDEDDGEDELPEGDGEDGDEESEALSKGSIAKMTDSEIDLDAIEDDSDEEEDGSENLNLSDDFAPNGRSKVPNNPNNGPTMPAAARLTGKFSFESKSDDNF